MKSQGKLNDKAKNLELIRSIKKNLSGISISGFAKHIGKSRQAIYANLSTKNAAKRNVYLLIDIAEKLTEYRTQVDTNTSKKIKSLLK